MLVSIVIPIYNAETYLKICLERLMALEMNDVEFICVDDGSSDNSFNLCKMYSERDCRIKVIKQKNSGVSCARNTGLKNSTGKYVAFVDADDWILPGYDKMLDKLRTLDCDLICFDYEYWYSENKVDVCSRGYSSCKVSENEILQKLLSGKSNNVWSNIYRRKIIEEKNIRFPGNITIGEDYFFNLKYFCEIKNIFYINEALYCYNLSNQSSAMHKISTSRIQDYMVIFDEIESMCRKKNLDFTFDYNYYLDEIFFNLFNSITVDKDLHKKFQNSKLKQEIAKYPYREIRRVVKKEMIVHGIYMISFVRKIIRKMK